jgi:hypothetical protein
MKLGNLLGLLEELGMSDECDETEVGDLVYELLDQLVRRVHNLERTVFGEVSFFVKDE